LLGKVASGLEKVEDLIERYVPLTEEQKRDTESDTSSESDSSCLRINRSVVSIMTRLLFVFMSFPVQLKTPFMNGTLKASMGKFTADMKCTLISKAKSAKVSAKERALRIKDKTPTKAQIKAKVEQLLTQVTDKLAPMVAALTQTSLFKKAVQMALLGCEKTLGKEKTTTILSKAETCIPAAWNDAMPAPSAAPSKPVAKQAAKPVDVKKDEQQEHVRQRNVAGSKGKGNSKGNW